MKQLGFGFGVLDTKGNPPDFITTLDKAEEALAYIEQSKWVCLDVETTGLTEASTPVALSPAEKKQEAREEVRLRTIQARIGINEESGKIRRMDFVFDCDCFSPKQLQRIATSILSRDMLVAHNAGFDLYWVRRAQGRSVMPKYTVDTMLLTRLLLPELVLERAFILKSLDLKSDTPLTAVQKAARDSLVKGGSGASLADVVLSLFSVVLDKTYQLPKNWTGLLDFPRYHYALDDIIWADRILCKLLSIAEDGDPYMQYLQLRESNQLVQLVEPQVPELVLLREHGMPLNQELGLHYAKLQTGNIKKKAQGLINLVPGLEKFKKDLEDPDTGRSDELQTTLAKAFQEKGVTLRVTEATHTEQIGEKDLRACKAERIEAAKPLFDAWVGLCQAKKKRSMALDVVAYAQRSDGGRLRSLLSHGPVTGRLAASEPNCQQWPRDQIFRAMCMSDEIESLPAHPFTVKDSNLEFLEKISEQTLEIGTKLNIRNDWLSVCYLMEKSAQRLPDSEKLAIEEHLNSAFTHRIVASDFGALDVRVGAALCIRTQREILDFYNGKAIEGGVTPNDEVLLTVRQIMGATKTTNPELRQKSMLQMEKQFLTKTRITKECLTQLMDKKENGAIGDKKFWTERQLLKDRLLLEKLGVRLTQCLRLGDLRNEQEYSALRDAFKAEIDIHTFTGMKLMGRDPLKEFEGLALKERKVLEAKLKKELGSRRQQGKIANLSLLYGMGDAGFQEAAARNYDEHWSLEDTHAIRDLWMEAYPEVELWHIWTEFLQAGIVYIPAKARPMPKRTPWWRARTLAGRTIIAFGLNAALSYQDQSTGADILGMIMHTLNTQYPEIFQWAINQIHDELVFSWPKEHHEEYLPIVEKVMVDEANKLTMPYGVPCAVSPACGVFWIKD